MQSDRSTKGSLCAIGIITRPFGVRGEITVQSYGRAAEEFASLATVKVGFSPGETQERIVGRAVSQGGRLRIKLREIDDRTAAQKLVGQFLFVEETRQRRLPKGSFFVDDIVGMTVVRERGETLGVIREVLRNGAHDIYVVRTRSATVLFPAVVEFIKNVDLKRRTMTILPPDGMFDGETA